MANHLQPMSPFLPQSDPTNTSARWSLWMERFDNYLRALNITNEGRKRALLLYQVGDDVYKIFKTLSDAGEDNDYAAAVDALTKYFEPAKNPLYQTYSFRQASQREDETIDEFHTRLRQLAKHCDFHDEDFEIKLQIVCNGKSSRLRKKALREPELKLQDMIIEGRKSETSSAQASGMETKSTEESQVNVVQKGSRTCYNCGFRYPHYENRPCPAKDQTCNKCGVKGHFARVCKQKEDVSYKRSERRTNADTKPRPKSTKGRKHAHAIALQENTDDSSDSEYAYAVRGNNLVQELKLQ